MPVAEPARAPLSNTARYAQCIAVSKPIRWDIELHMIRGRTFDFSKHFLPDGLSRISRLDFLKLDEQRLLSQVQGRTYANMLGLVERFIGAKMLQITRAHWFGDRATLEALARIDDEEVKHQALFRRIERMAGAGMPEGYQFVPEPNAVATRVMAASTWAVLGLICHIELFTQVHYHHSMQPDDRLSGLYKDVFFFHWKEEAQHALIDELEWARENARLAPAQRDRAVDEFIALFGLLDAIVQAQARADAHYFLSICRRSFDALQTRQLGDGLLGAYRWQYIVCGMQDERFRQLLGSMTTPEQGERIRTALMPLMA